MSPSPPDAAHSTGVWKILTLTAGLLFAGYLICFLATLQQPALRSALYAAINAIAALASACLFLPVLSWLQRRPARFWTLALQPVLAAAFALTWYLLTLLGFSLSLRALDAGLSTSPFGAAALSWQMVQGVTLYAVYWLALERRILVEPVAASEPAPAAAPASKPSPRSLLVKGAQEVSPVLVADIVSIAGVDGYSEVSTRSGKVLSTTSLARFEEMLSPDDFVRAHRSCIVRLDAVARAEPGGNGRLLLHLVNGETLLASRAGSRRLRDLAV